MNDPVFMVCDLSNNVGRKGHRELCIYEKGKQLKDESSPWLRIEQRFYGKHFREDSSENLKLVPAKSVVAPAAGKAA